MNSETNFWQKNTQPIFCLAPMEDVTDTVFREIVMHISQPEMLHVVFTEFASTDGLCHEQGLKNTVKRLFVNQSEQELLKEKNIKLVAQIWGSNPDHFYSATKYISENYAFDGIDINMGCPVKKIVKNNSCSALIKDPGLAKEIIYATKEATHLPVSVKTRIGFSKPVTNQWISTLLETKLAAITIHGRTQKMMSKGKADWIEIHRAVTLRNQLSVNTKIIGNGDIDSMDLSQKHLENTNVDGVMIGRGIFKNPWIFNSSAEVHSPEQKLNLLMFHAEKYCETWGEEKPFNILKRFFKIYCNGFEGAAELRNKIMNCNTFDELRRQVYSYTSQLKSLMITEKKNVLLEL